MKKGFSIVFIALMCFQLAASVMEYDIGGGQTLLLKEDGTYEIIKKTIDINKIIGKQYKFDLCRSVDLLISIVMLEDPTNVTLGKDYGEIMLSFSEDFPVYLVQQK